MFKKFACLLLVFVMILGLCACGESGAKEESKGLQVGFGRENIMPDEITNAHLGGDDDAFRKATGFLDLLKLTCIAIDDGNGEQVLVYTSDIVGIYSNWLTSMVASVTNATGIPKERIVFATTHTHSGISMTYNWNGLDQYKAKVQMAMIQTAQTALADLAPAKMSFGSSFEDDLIFVRHYTLNDGRVTSSGVADGSPTITGYAAEKDSEMQVVMFDREEGKKDVIMMCFNPHSTFNGNVALTDISADFPGPTRDYIESQGDYLVAYFIGDGGNQAPTTKYTPDKHGLDYKQYGQELGKRVLNLLPNLTPAESGDLVLNSRTYNGKYNKEHLDALEQAQEVIAVHEQYGREKSQPLAESYGIYGRTEAYAIVRRASAPDHNDMDLRVMAIGPQVSFLFAPYEMFAEHGSYMRENTVYDITFIASCTDGGEGYLPSLAAFEYGCYESYTTNFARGTGEELAETYLDMLSKMKEGHKESIEG